MKYKLGKTPAKPSYSPLKFADIFDTSKLPKPPPIFGHYAAVQQYHMLGNDDASCCVFSGAAHLEYIWSIEGGRQRVRITTKDVLSDYAAVTGYDGTEATDNGADMQDAAEYWRRTGMLAADGTRHRIDCAVPLETGNFDQLVLALWLTGGAGIGLQLPESAEGQFDRNEPWTVMPSKIRGGHYVCGVGRDPSGNIPVVTWGQVQPMTRAFYEHFCDEAYVYLSAEILSDKGLSPEGFDLEALRNYISNL
jgi:hypothetical protein